MKKLGEQERLEQLEEAARSLGIEVRYESFKGESSFSPGGLCRLKGNYLLIVNNKASVGERISAVASAVNRFELGGTYLRPGLREFLESVAGGRGETAPVAIPEEADPQEPSS